MKLPLTNKEVVLVSIIILGAVIGGGIHVFAGASEIDLPDFGPAPVDSAANEERDAEKSDTRETTREPKLSKPVRTGPVNINTANALELTRLSGIGPKTAEKIIADRAANGPYRSPEDLQRVKGIGPATVEKNRNMISIGN